MSERYGYPLKLGVVVHLFLKRLDRCIVRIAVQERRVFGGEPVMTVLSNARRDAGVVSPCNDPHNLIIVLQPPTSTITKSTSQK